MKSISKINDNFRILWLKIKLQNEEDFYCMKFDFRLKKTKLIRNVLINFLLLTSLTAFGQFKYVVNGTVLKGGKKLDAAQVTLFKGSSQVQQVSTSGGKFTFNLDPNAEYTISITKAGHITKKFMIITMGFSEETAKNFNGKTEPQIEIFEMPKDPSIVSQINQILSKPVGKMYYDPSKDNIINDDNYSNANRSAIEALIRLEEEARKKAEEEGKKKGDLLRIYF